MKRPLFVIVPCLLLSLMLNSCGRGRDCSDDIPDESQISWTDYNTVQQYGDFFLCHPKAAEKYVDDTIRVCGWIVWKGDSQHPIHYAVSQKHPYKLQKGGDLIYISDDSTNTWHHPAALLRGWKWTDVPESLWYKKIYIKGILCYDGDMAYAYGCCAYSVCPIYVLQVDSIPIK